MNSASDLLSVKGRNDVTLETGAAALDSNAVSEGNERKPVFVPGFA